MDATSARSLLSILLVAVVLGPLVGAVAGGAAVAPSAEPGERASALVDLQTAPEADNTITRIVVHENGSATWTLQIRTRLGTDEAEAEYREFQERFRENTSRYLDGFRESITAIVGGAGEVTGREMGASGFRASTSVQTIPRRWGVVTFEFRWNGFAAVDGERLLVGDVFEGGLFIAEGDSLEVVAPDGYRIQSAEPTPDETDDDVVTWTGREDFADRRPRVVVVPEEPNEADGLPWQALAGGAALLGLVTVGGVGYRRYRHRRGGAGHDDEPGPADEPILADEDHVLRLLSEHGGRMRQQAIAEELDWSRSKTSRVLGRMADDEQVRKLRLGRENVIALPDEADGE